MMQLAVHAVQSLGWVVTNVSDGAAMLTFETKMSLGSYSGVTCSLSFLQVAPATWHVSGAGKQNLPGRQAFAIDFGEAQRKAERAIRQIKESTPRI